MHSGPLMHESWILAVGDEDPESKNIELITELIREEGKLRMQQHQRRIQLLKAKRGSEKHRDFLKQLGNQLSVVE